MQMQLQAVSHQTTQSAVSGPRRGGTPVQKRLQSCAESLRLKRERAPLENSESGEGEGEGEGDSEGDGEGRWGSE